jgi:glycopeptide antibiotics resistance protein
VAAVIVAAGAGLLSLGVEFGQLWLDRTPSRFDVYAQWIGGALGLAVWVVAGGWLTEWVSSFARERRTSGRLVWALKAYYGLFLLASVVPLDVTLHPGDLYAKYQRGRIALAPFASFALTPEFLFQALFDALLCVPLGALGVLLLSRGRETPLRSLSGGVAIGTGLVAAIELSQLFVVSRFTETGDVLVGGVGVVAGAVLAWVVERRRGVVTLPDTPMAQWGPALRWAGLAAAYVAVPCLFFWWPFNFTGDREVVRSGWRHLAGVPLDTLNRSSILNAHTQIMRQVLLFVPLGVLLGCAARRSLGRGRLWLNLAAMGLILLVAFAIELGQIFLPGRTPDPGSILLMAGGGLLGLAATLAIQPLRPVRRKQEAGRPMPG